MIALPPWIDPEAWAGFVEMRKAKGKRYPFTERAAKLIIKELDRLRSMGHPPNEVLNQSTMNGWSGVFPLKSLENVTRPASEADKTRQYLDSQKRDPEEIKAAARRARELLQRVH